MRLAKRMDLLGTESAFEVLARAKRLEEDGRSIVHLEIGEPDFATPAHIVAAAEAAIEEGYTHYTPAGGIPEVRAAVASQRDRDLLLDGEVVVLDDEGRPSFQLLQNRGTEPRPMQYVVFDIVYLDGQQLLPGAARGSQAPAARRARTSPSGRSSRLRGHWLRESA